MSIRWTGRGFDRLRKAERRRGQRAHRDPHLFPKFLPRHSVIGGTLRPTPFNPPTQPFKSDSSTMSGRAAAKASKAEEIEDPLEISRYPSPPPHLTHASRGVHVRVLELPVTNSSA